MDRLLALACFITGAAMVMVAFPDGNVALLGVVTVSLPGVLLIRYLWPDDADLLTRIFIIGLLARLGFGLLIIYFGLRDFFGGDAATYDHFGNVLMDSWFNPRFDPIEMLILEYRTAGVGWGMLYLVAGMYSVFGRNALAAQSICAVVGAGIAPLVYVCSFKIFKNKRAATIAAAFVAVSPAFVIWTGQLMKDGLIIFMLVLAIICVLRLQEKFGVTSVLFLILALFGIVSLRFYIFYMIALAVVGSFILSRNSSPQVIARNLVILLIMGGALTYLGVSRYATDEFERYGNLERLQRGREDLANRAESGFGQDTDVSTVTGAVAAVPIGLAYVYLAPFPWEMTNFRQAVTLPDMLIWWASLPFLLSGLIYALKRRLLGSVGILIFVFMLSIAYSISQGNVGTAYRQRTQFQVFLFIFVGVGWTLFLERRENKRMLLNAQKRRVDAMLRANFEKGED